MPDEIKEESKNSKSEKETNKVDKIFLTKAKDSRDLIDKKLRTFETSIEDISSTMEKDSEIHTVEDVDQELKDSQIKLENCLKKVEEKQEYITALDQNILSLEEKYALKNEEINNLEEGLKITKESMEHLDEEYKELLKNNEQLIQTYETRQVDLIVLTDSVKEKITLQDELRTKISKLNQKIDDNKNTLELQAEETEALEKKIKSLKAENETLKVTIGKNKFELDHSNKEIEAKEEERKLLSEQIEKKELKIKNQDSLIKEYNEGFPEMQKHKEAYDEILTKYKYQMTEKQQELIAIESRIQTITSTHESLQDQVEKTQNLFEINEKRVENLKAKIEVSNNEYKEREERLKALTEKLVYTEADHEKLIKAKEIIDVSINDSKIIFQKLKGELDSQEKEIRDKESRIQRLEVLSLFYRASKFFGGILICVGIFFVILAIGYITKVLNLGDLNADLIIFLSLLGAVLTIISGIFHLEKS